MTEDDVAPIAIFEIVRTDTSIGDERSVLCLAKGDQGFIVFEEVSEWEPIPDKMTAVTGNWSADMDYAAANNGTTFIAVGSNEQSAWTSDEEMAKRVYQSFGGVL